MGSFLENIVKNVVMGSLSGSSKGGGLQDILGKLGVGVPAAEEEVQEPVVEEEMQEQIVEEESMGSLQDILGKLSTGGLQDILGKLGGMATGSINIINIAKEAMGGAMAKAATESKADDGFEEVE
jgi:hypothetical protein